MPLAIVSCLGGWGRRAGQDRNGTQASVTVCPVPLHSSLLCITPTQQRKIRWFPECSEFLTLFSMKEKNLTGIETN